MHILFNYCIKRGILIDIQIVILLMIFNEIKFKLQQNKTITPLN